MENIIRHEMGGGINKTKLVYNKNLINLVDETRKTYNIQTGTLIDEELAGVLREHLNLFRKKIDICYEGDLVTKIIMRLLYVFVSHNLF